MLDSETKRRIDTARDILVGKVPDPKSQVEQITIALIYKFMDDMDAEAEELGGVRSFFVGEYEKFSWAKLLNPALGGYEMLSLYTEAVEKMTRNEGIPQLFRDIFKNAYLPYRDPETLKMFLKVINDFNYEHSEKLGDAFEYLLSVLGSQGDAGQFRTPRHIIDFMVKVVDPKKEDTILDPACGTAGFLISAYKHILAENSAPTPSPLPGPPPNGTQFSPIWGRVAEGRVGAGLTPEERTKLANNIRGYDISPDMVRLSLVNLYLHGFSTPNIYEYDTLTSDERWNEYADVILANPPFMSPKGGIKPHKRFSVQSNRSEVLFVDYMAEHLTPNGRAAIIVPEGIIFQSAGAYKQLRKYLIESNYLWVVVSLPAGVFNPYAGVKTSILFLDKSLAKKTDQILFVKVEADGFDLGAQRRPIDKNDLPEALNVLREWRDSVGAGLVPAQFSPTQGDATPQGDHKGRPYIIVPISKLAETGDYNLSADRYREVIRIGKQTWPMVTIGDICTFEYGKSLKAENRIEGEYPVYGSNGIVGYHNEYLVEAPFLVVGRKGSAGEVHYSDKNGFPIDTTFYVNLENEDKVILKYLFHILKGMDLQSVNTQAGVPGLNRNDAYAIQIPLPPLEIQRQLVDEIAAHQRIIDGARQVIEGWKPNLELAESLPEGMDEWEKVELGDVCSFVRGPFGGSLRKEIFVKDGYLVYEQYHAINNDFDFGRYFIDENKFQEMKRFEVFTGDVLVSCSGTMGRVAIVPTNHRQGIINQALLKLTPLANKINTVFLKYLLEGDEIQNKYFRNQPGVAIQNVASVSTLKTMRIPLPPLEIQRAIVARIERERLIVEGNRELIRLYEVKVKKVIERVWES